MYANEQGGWTNTDCREILGLVALIIYMNVMKVPRLADCRSTTMSLFALGTSQLFQTVSPTNCFTNI